MKSVLVTPFCLLFFIQSTLLSLPFGRTSTSAFVRDFRKFFIGPRSVKHFSGRDHVIFDTIGLVERHGYPAEEHRVVTNDGYELRIFRIAGSPLSPRADDRGIVFLQHGILWSSDAFVLRGPAHDLSFMLADAGYDVWMGNVRGNTYGTRHQAISRKDPKFWDFSYHEMGTEDLPAMIDYVLANTSRRSLHYVGHSMGATIAYVMLSLKPEYNAKIKLVVSLAPVTLWRHRLNPMQTFFSQVGLTIEDTLNRNEVCEILPQTSLFARQVDQWCSEDAVSYTACLNMIFGFVGEDREQLNATLLPYLFSYFPAGTSLRTIVHFHQNMRSGEFSRYDFMAEKNLARYRQLEPPFYPLWKVTAPVALIYGKNDAIVTAAEMYELARYLGNVETIEAVPFGKFNHMDFIWARDVKELLYKRVLQLIA